MAKALWNSGHAAPARRLDWRRKISDHVAYGLLVYTGIQIFVTMGALKEVAGHSILPFFGLVILVAAIIPGCRFIEHRWERLSDDQAADPVFAPRYRRDRLVIWVAAIVLPLLVTAAIRVAEPFIL